MADSMTEVRKLMIRLLPGKVQQTDQWKKMFTVADKTFLFLFEIPAEVFYDEKVLNLGFPCRGNIWKVDMENGQYFPLSYHT